jgi:hypothetical protein
VGKENSRISGFSKSRRVRLHGIKHEETRGQWNLITVIRVFGSIKMEPTNMATFSHVIISPCA